MFPIFARSIWRRFWGVGIDDDEEKSSIVHRVHARSKHRFELPRSGSNPAVGTRPISAIALLLLTYSSIGSYLERFGLPVRDLHLDVPLFSLTESPAFRR